MERAIEVAESLGDREALLRCLGSLWTSRFVQGRTADSYAVANRALGLAREGFDGDATAHFAVGGTAISLGRIAEGIDHLERAVTLAGRSVSLPVGTRPDVHGRAWAAHGHWLRGDGDRALRYSQEAIELAREIEQPFSLAVALAYGAITRHMLGQVDAVGKLARELTVLCRRYGFAYYDQWAVILGAWAADDEAAARAGIAALRAAGSFARMPYWLTLRADLLARRGDDESAAAAHAVLDAAAAGARGRDDVWWLPEVLRLRAHREPDPTPRLREALALARQHGSDELVRRCEADLAGR